MSGVLLAGSLPTFLVGPVAGVFADRWEKRGLMMRMDALRALLILLLILGTGVLPLPLLAGASGPLWWRLGLLYSVVLLTHICDQFFNPANAAMLGLLVEESEQARASGLNQVTGNLALVVGPAVGTVIFFTVGVTWALVVDSFTFLVSFLAIRAIRPPQVPRQGDEDEGEFRPSFFREFRDGIRFYASNRVLMTVLVTGSIVLFGAGAFNALDIFFVVRNLHTSASLYGIVGSAAGLGAIGGAAIATVYVPRLGAARVFWVSIVAVGVVVVLFSRMTSVVPALVLAFLIGFTNTPIDVALMPLLLRVTPKALVGRVVAVLVPAMSAASMLSVALAGYLSSTVLRDFHTSVLGMSFGPVDTIFAGAGVCAVIAGIYAMVNLRDARLGDAISPPRAM